MKRLDGVSQTKLRMGRETRIEVRTRAGAWVAPEALLEQIARGRFDARREDVRLTVAGVVQNAEGALRLELPEQGSVILRLGEFSTGKPGKASPLQELAEHAGERVEVTGLWRPGSPPAAGRLLVREWKVVSRKS